MLRCSFLLSKYTQVGATGYIPSTFLHSLPAAAGLVDVLYFPPKDGAVPSDVIVFFPGNPGLAGYYPTFLSHLHKLVSARCALIAVSHVGHSPALPHPSAPFTLAQQISAKSDFLRCLHIELRQLLGESSTGHKDDAELPSTLRNRKRSHSSDTKSRDPRIAVMGHSVGAEIAVQAMRQVQAQGTAYKDDEPSQTSSTTLEEHVPIEAAFLLFPTLAHIARSPNGIRLRPIFHFPLLQLLPLLSIFLQPVVYFLRLFAKSSSSSSSVYAPNATTLSFLLSPRTIHNSLCLARSEMEVITDPDLGWYAGNRKKIWSYWGVNDGWVGTQGDEVKDVLREGAGASSAHVLDGQQGGSRVVDCVNNVPHAFCLAHSESIAETVAVWVKEAFPESHI